MNDTIYILIFIFALFAVNLIYIGYLDDKSREERDKSKEERDLANEFINKQLLITELNFDKLAKDSKSATFTTYTSINELKLRLEEMDKEIKEISEKKIENNCKSYNCNNKKECKKDSNAISK